jgi:pSer/pThr/pTyr-binding forkhead associated (FHA) protein
VVVGRSVEEGSRDLGLDLTEYGGSSQGVSRFHAAFSWDDDNQLVCVEDLGSTSGTRINGLPLEAHRTYHLRSGDELEFGRVRVTVRFEKTSP